ncbi:hypothetical protein C8Q80DRAFT_1265160 [Daedaleopsis nitida]|nr:hypothetical protein C8Q80DRAFT_1265160 [Daedaleopsis nitida]
MPDVLFIVRRDADSGGKLSTSTIIIIAVVSGSVLILILALFAWRLIVRHCRASRTVALPPVQDLAHHREQQLVAFTDRNAASRPTTWVEPHLFQPHPKLYSSHFLAASASSASLIHNSPDFSASQGLTRESSWAGSDPHSADSSPFPTPRESTLIPPNPSFLPGYSAVAQNSMTSVASSSSDVVSAEVAANTPTSPSDLNHSVESSSVSLSTSAHGSPARPRPPRAPRSRSRPMSMVSSAGTTHSMSQSHSANTLRGPAHSIHSNIQIVLPAPLAPELYPGSGGHVHERTNSFHGGGDRRSVADQWVMAGSRPPSMARLEREASSSSQHSSAGPRSSFTRQRSGLHKVSSSASLPESDGASTKSRRSQSQPPVAHTHGSSAPAVSRARTPSPSRHPSMFVPSGSPLPPVPRVPSMYGRASIDNDTYAPPASREPVRGRPHDPAPLSVSGSALQPPMSYPTPTPVDRREPSGKLRKNRASSHGRS